MILQTMEFKDYKKYLFRILKEVIWPYKLIILFNIVLMIIIAGTNSFQAYLIQPAVDQSLFNTANNAILLQIPILIFVVTLGKGIATYYNTVISASLAARMTNDMRYRLFRKFIESDITYFNNSSASRMMSNIVNDINGMMGAINLILSGVFKNFFSVIFLFGVMLFMNYKLTLISLIGVPLAAYPIVLVYRKINKYMVRNQQQLELFTVLMDDSLRAIRVVKSYNAEEFESKKVKKSLDGLYKLAWRISRISNIPSPLNESLIGIGTAGVLFYGGTLVMDGHATPGSFFAFFAALMMAYKPMKSIGNINVQLHICLICAGRVFGLLDTKAHVVDKPDAIEMKNVKGNIEFENVNFSYNSSDTVINGLSFKAEAGKKYALVGHSGGGKSTIMNLLLRFHDVTSGSVKIDGNDVRDITQKSLRDAVAYVGQDVQLFDDTVIENIRYGKQDATEEEIIEAAKIAEAHEFILKLEGGYHSRVGQNGQKLSGGQRQRIAIARAVLKNAPVLLLDEATSALDTTSEHAVKNALHNLMEGRTTIAIAHRLTTVKNSDKIIVISHGRIIEEGSHEELISRNGEYANLYSKQFVD